MSVIKRTAAIGSLLLLVFALLMGVVRQEQSTAYCTQLINPNLSMRLIALSPVVDKPFSELQLISSAIGGLLLIALYRRKSTHKIINF